MDPNFPFRAIGDGKKKGMEDVACQEAIGSVMWAMRGTRFGIAYFVSMLAIYNLNPGREHCHAVKRLIWYMGCTADYVMYCGSNDSQHILEGYCDSD